jgi:hypothetical protein
MPSRSHPDATRLGAFTAPAAAAPEIVGPGTCAPYSDSITFTVDPAEPTFYCFSGHGTANEGVSDVYHVYAGAATSGWFYWDYGDGSCRNYFAFLPYQQNDFPTPISICSGWHLN